MTHISWATFLAVRQYHIFNNEFIYQTSTTIGFQDSKAVFETSEHKKSLLVVVLRQQHFVRPFHAKIAFFSVYISSFCMYEKVRMRLGLRINPPTLAYGNKSGVLSSSIPNKFFAVRKSSGYVRKSLYLKLKNARLMTDDPI